jgi:acetolactate synthase-1/2/3 large subunit
MTWTTDSVAPQSPLEWQDEEPSVSLARVPELQRTADTLIDMLVQAGVEVVFGLPGGTIAPLFDALIDRPEIRVISSRHESGAMFAAAAYARATGKLGVVFVTSGPGALNAVTGLASAHCDGLPILLIAGEVAREVAGRRALQEGTSYHLNVIGMLGNISKLALAVPSPDLAPPMLKRAIDTAMEPRRGAVALTLPIDVACAAIRPAKIAVAGHIGRSIASLDMGRAVRQAAIALADVRRPLIFAGSGVRWGRGPSELLRLAELLQAPVMTTPKGKGVFPESHPLSLGVFGHGGHPSAAQYLENGCDTLLAIGTGLSDPATDDWSDRLIPTGQFIHVDHDLTQIGRNYAATMGLIGDADDVLWALSHALRGMNRRPRRFGVQRLMDPALHPHGARGRITPQRALWELETRLPQPRTFACDIGEHLLFATHYLRIDDPYGFSIMTGLASMGSSVASAIGHHLADPNRIVAAICGDGCFSMALSDVAVAAAHSVPLIVAVINDGRYGMVEHGNRAVYGRTPSYSMAPMSVSDLARGAGAIPIVIERAGQILDLDLASHPTRPIVLDIHVDEEETMPKSQRFTTLRASTHKSR